MNPQTLAKFYSRVTSSTNRGGELDVEFEFYCDAYIELVRSRRTYEIYASSRKMTEHTSIWFARYDFKLIGVHEGMVAHLPYSNKVVGVDGAVQDQFENRQMILIGLIDNIQLTIPDGSIPNYTQPA